MRYNGRRAALRRHAVSYRDIRRARRCERAGQSEHRDGAVHSGDAGCGVRERGNRSYRSALSARAARGFRLCVHEPAARRGRARDAAGHDAKRSARGERYKRRGHSRAARAHLRSAALRARGGYAPARARFAHPHRLRAVRGVPALLHIHHDDRRARHRPRRGREKGKGQRVHARRRFLRQSDLRIRFRRYRE